MARLRLGYTKSRSGCQRCKARRVKCDETRPSCRACVRHGIECSLSRPTIAGASPSTTSASSSRPSPSPGPSPAPPPASTPRSGARPIDPRPMDPEPNRPSPAPSGLSGPSGDLGPEAVPSPAQTLKVEASPSPTTPDPFPYFAKFVTGPPEQDTANWVFDLELLHHFTTSTYRTFLAERHTKETEPLWQIEVPKQGFVHVFLLHQILAISASHLAQLHPQSRQAYSVRASQHQSIALRGMRVALTHITPDNCHALFATSSLLFISSLGASATAQPGADGRTVDDLVDVFHLVKGVGSVLNSSQTLLRSGPLSGLFLTNEAQREPGVTLNRIILSLKDFLVDLIETKSDEGARAIIRAEVDRLVTAIGDSVVKSNSPEYRVVAVWPILMSDDLIPLLRQRNPAALALLSYYCVVLHAAEIQGYWFLRGWPEGVLRDISKTMTPSWNRHLAWAIGWVTGQANTMS